MNEPQPTEHEKKEKTILRAALTAYARYGLTATTRQIAEIAGVGKTTLYEYFKNKDDLKNAAFRYLLSGMEAEHTAIHQIAREDPVGALARYLDSAVRMSLEEPSALLLLSQYSLGILLAADRFDTARDDYRKKMYPVMQSLTDEFRYIVMKGIGRGVFHPPADLTPEGMVYTVCALIREIQAQAFLQDRDELEGTCTLIRDTVCTILGIDARKEGV